MINEAKISERHVQWYVATTLPGKEEFACQNLRGQNFQVFFPKIVSTRNVRRPTSASLVPLFPGYVFTRFSRAADRWQAINGTRGVRRLICAASGAPIPVRQDVMTHLIDRCVDGVWQTMPAAFVKGQPITMIDGPLAGCTGELDRLLPNDRVRILVEILGNKVTVNTSIKAISLQ